MATKYCELRSMVLDIDYSAEEGTLTIVVYTTLDVNVFTAKSALAAELWTVSSLDLMSPHPWTGDQHHAEVIRDLNTSRAKDMISPVMQQGRLVGLIPKSWETWKRCRGIEPQDLMLCASDPIDSETAECIKGHLNEAAYVM